MRHRAAIDEKTELEHSDLMQPSAKFRLTWQ